MPKTLPNSTAAQLEARAAEVQRLETEEAIRNRDELLEEAADMLDAAQVKIDSLEESISYYHRTVEKLCHDKNQLRFELRDQMRTNIQLLEDRVAIRSACHAATPVGVRLVAILQILDKGLD